MGFFDIALRCALVVASVVADGGGLNGKQHQNNNVEIGFGNGGLIASFSEPSRIRAAGHADAGKFLGSGGSLHSSGSGFSHDRLVNNDIGGGLGSQHGVAGELGNVGSRHGSGVKNIGDGLKGSFDGGISEVHSFRGGQSFGGVGGHSEDGIKEGLGGGITQTHNIHGVSSAGSNFGRGSFTGSHGAGHAGGPLIIQGQGFRFEETRLKDGNSFAGHQGTELATTHGGFGTSHGRQDAKRSSFGSGHGIGSGHSIGSGHGIGSGRGIGSGQVIGSGLGIGSGGHSIGSGQGIGSGRGSLNGKFEGFASDFGRGQVDAHGSNLDDEIFEMLDGHKLIGFDAGVVDGQFQPLKGGHLARGKSQSFSRAIHGGSSSNFGRGIGGEFGRHNDFHGSIGGEISGSRDENINSFSADTGHKISGDSRNEIKDESFRNGGNIRKFNSELGGVEFSVLNGGFGEGKEDFAASQGHSKGIGSGSLDFKSGPDFGHKDQFGRDDHLTAHSAGGNGGGFSHQSSFLGGSSSLGGFGSEISEDKLKRGTQGGIVEGGAIGNNNIKFKGTVNHAGYRGDNIDTGVGGDSLHNFGGVDHEKNDGDSLRGFGSSIGHGGKNEGSLGGFDSSNVHGGKGSFDSSIVHRGKEGGHFGGFDSSIVHGGKGGSTFESFGSSIAHGGKEGGNFGGFDSSIFHGGKGGGTFGSFGSSIIQGGREGGSFGGFDSSIVHGGKGGGTFGSFGSSIAHGGKEGGSFGGFDSSIVHGGKGESSFGSFGSSIVPGGKGRSGIGGFGSSIVHGGKFRGFGGDIGHGSGFDFGGFGQHAIDGGVGKGNFFGYTEDDFFGIGGGKEGDFTDGLAGLGNIGARVVSYDGHEIHVGDSGVGSFGGTLSGRGIGHGKDAINSGFIGGLSDGHNEGLPHGGVASNSFNIGHGGGFQDFDGGATFGGGFEGGKLKGFGNIAAGKIEGLGNIEGKKLGGHSDGVHRDIEAGGVKGDIGGSFDERKFERDVGVHGGAGHDGGLGSIDGKGASVSVHGQGKLVAHQPGNPYGINGSA